MGIEWDVKEDFCKKCGKILRYNEKRCPCCGAPQCKSERIKPKKRKGAE
jgi:RNA polymerase subunit RPABC4/transcription elongation factor Spt4